MKTGTLERTTASTEPFRKKGGGFFALGVVLIALALGFLYAFAVDRLHRKAALAESNFQVNLLRIGEFLYAKQAPDIVMVGSSLTGRLLPDFFKEHKPLNLSLDGSTVRMGMSIIAAKGEPVRYLLVEENRVNKPDSENELLLSDALKEPQMRAAKWFPFLRAAYRPSSVLYFALKAKVDASAAPAPASNPVPVASSLPLQDNLQHRSKEILEAEAMIRILRANGTQVIIFGLPEGNAPKFGPSVLQQDLGPEVPYIDVGAELAAVGHLPLYSDGMHLLAPSAKAASTVLERALAKLIAQQPRTNPK